MNSKFDFKSVYRHTAQEFEKDMENVIKVWKAAENDLYSQIRNIMTSITTPKSGQGTESVMLITPLVSFLCKGGQSEFPTNFHKLWISIDHDPLFLDPDVYSYTPDELVDMTDYAVQADGISPYGPKRTYNLATGHRFEDIMINFYKEDHKLIQEICKLIFPDMKITAKKNLREDIALTADYTMDFKFSSKIYDSTGQKLKSIVKDWGSGEYNNIVDIEDSIIRSLYTFGSSEGRDKGGVDDYGIWKSEPNGDQGRTFTELTYSKGYRGSFKTIGGEPVLPTRKILLFLFPEDGYWASYCLKEITRWASKRIVEMEFINKPINLHESLASLESVDYKDFWL